LIKRGQYALEFLLTYAWGIATILIIVGAIGYFGLLRPSTHVPDACIAEDGFACVEFSFYTNEVVIRLRNNVGHPINITGVDVITVRPYNPDCDFSKKSLHKFNGREDVSLGAGEVFNFSINCTNNELISGDLFKIDFALNYEINRPGYFPRSSIISVSSRVIDEIWT